MTCLYLIQQALITLINCHYSVESCSHDNIIVRQIFRRGAMRQSRPHPTPLIRQVEPVRSDFQISRDGPLPRDGLWQRFYIKINDIQEPSRFCSSPFGRKTHKSSARSSPRRFR